MFEVLFVTGASSLAGRKHTELGLGKCFETEVEAFLPKCCEASDPISELLLLCLTLQKWVSGCH